MIFVKKKNQSNHNGQVVIRFSFASDWLRLARVFFLYQSTEQSEALNKAHRGSFDTQLKITPISVIFDCGPILFFPARYNVTSDSKCFFNIVSS